MLDVTPPSLKTLIGSQTIPSALLRTTFVFAPAAPRERNKSKRFYIITSKETERKNHNMSTARLKPYRHIFRFFLHGQVAYDLKLHRSVKVSSNSMKIRPQNQPQDAKKREKCSFVGLFQRQNNVEKHFSLHQEARSCRAAFGTTSIAQKFGDFEEL